MNRTKFNFSIDEMREWKKLKVSDRIWKDFLQNVEKNRYRYDLMSRCYSYYDYNYETENRFLNLYDWLQKYDCCLERDYCIIMDLKYEPVKKYTWNYLTLSPFPKLCYSDTMKLKLVEFCDSIFNSITMSKYHWVIESGKDKDNPHLHIHALFVFNKGINKNWKRNVTKLFSKSFNSKIDWITKNGRGWYNKVINPKNNSLFAVMIQDKLDYFVDAKKGEMHGNFVDLGLRGSSED